MRLNSIAHDYQRSVFVTGSLVVFFACLLTVLLWVDQMELLPVAYLASAVFIGGWLYATASPWYLGFILFLWFITPFFRRIVDYHLGTFTPPSQSLILLTPFAVTLLTLLDLPRFGRKLIHRRYLPFLICLVGLVYGYLVGLTKIGLFGSTSMLIKWLPPILTGFYVLNRWKSFPRHRHIFELAFTWGVLVLSTYGLIQFFALPEWDALWMKHSRMISVGQPYPYQVRIFSMLDSPGPFSHTLMMGLVILFIGQGVLPIIAAVPGYVSFLLGKVRGAWIAWIIAIVYIIFQVKGRLRIRLLGITIAVAVLTIPIALQGPIANQTADRMQTLENLDQDTSFRARMSMYQTAPRRILMNPIGWGLGSKTYDSGIVTLFWQLGWLGGLLYLIGLGLLLQNMIRNSTFFSKISAGIIIAQLAHIFLGPQILLEVTGVVFWTLSSLAVASNLYSVRESH